MKGIRYWLEILHQVHSLARSMFRWIIQEIPNPNAKSTKHIRLLLIRRIFLYPLLINKCITYTSITRWDHILLVHFIFLSKNSTQDLNKNFRFHSGWDHPFHFLRVYCSIENIIWYMLTRGKTINFSWVKTHRCYGSCVLNCELLHSWNNFLNGLHIMTSSNWNIFRATGHLCEEFTGHRLSKQSWGWWFETPSRSLWRSPVNLQTYPDKIASRPIITFL